MGVVQRCRDSSRVTAVTDAVVRQMPTVLHISSVLRCPLMDYLTLLTELTGEPFVPLEAKSKAGMRLMTEESPLVYSVSVVSLNFYVAGLPIIFLLGYQRVAMKLCSGD